MNKTSSFRKRSSKSIVPGLDYLPKNPPFFFVFILAITAVMLIGTILLWLPQASIPGESTSFTDALFTSASSVSCTGLIVLDTATHWSFFGQVVILVLIQLGGFSFMITSAFLLIVIGKRLNLRDFRFSDALGASCRMEYAKFALQTFALAILFEGLGVYLLYQRFSDLVPAEDVLWKSIFHSVSAFNNAGFDIFGGEIYKELYSDSTLLLTISGLFILGGLSAPVLINLIASRRWKRVNLNSKIAITFTIGLLFAGVLGIFFMEYGNPDSLGPMSIPQKILNAFFYSSSTRTAGFGTLNLGTFGFQALALITILMFIGGVAGSTAGGIKVNTFATLILTMRSYIKGQSRVHAFGKQIPEGRIHEAITLFILAIVIVCVPVFILAITDNFPVHNTFFESVSAFGTVGLSTGITPYLSIAGRLVITILMFIGRLGPLAIVLAFSERRPCVEKAEPEESVSIW